MAPRNRVLAAGLAGFGLLLVTSCVSTPRGATGGGRMEELAGMPAVSAVLGQGAGRRVLIYHSPRCDFCRALLRSTEGVLPELNPRAVVYTLDIDRNPDVRDAMGIGPVPVVVFVENGREVRRWRGWRPSFVVRGRLRTFLAP